MGRAIRRMVAPAVVLALMIATVANAAEVTRESYREAVEPICKANTKANERIFAGVRTEVRKGKLKSAARQFEKAARALKATVAQLRAVPQPPADEARLAKWLADVGAEASLFERVAAKLKAGQKAAAEQLVVRLTHQAIVANSVVVPFQFHYCKLDPSRFT